MSVKAEFFSNTNFSNFLTDISLRYPSNLLETDDTDLTVVFKGDPPDHMVRDLIKSNGGELDE